jgi:hypothetical protein
VALLAIDSASLEGLGPAFTSLDHALTGSGSALPALLAPSGGCRLGSRIHQIRSRRNRRANQRSQDGRRIAWAHGGGPGMPPHCKNPTKISTASLAGSCSTALIRTTITHAGYLLAACLLNGFIMLRQALKARMPTSFCRPVSTRARTCWSKLARRRSCDNASAISGRSRCDLSGARRRGRGD